MDDERLVCIGVELEESFPPDVLNVVVSLGGDHESREECLQEYNETMRRLTEALVGAGIPHSEIKDGGFRLSPHVEDIYEKDDKEDKFYVRKRDIRGYEYDADVFLHTNSDIELARRIWTALATFGDDVFFWLNFGLEDEEAAKETLLERAVEEGKRRAEILARAAGGRIAGVKSIKYEYRSEGSRRHAIRRKTADSTIEAPVFNPPDVGVECEVNMQWIMELPV